ncbi:tail fiber protein [Escherichia coli]|uniref:tail fiber protein n=1 Tax=Escherichia coli TaxID=562 RepID=UPI002021EB2E|nr:phage tail protein [Escherichia coli]
MISINSRKYFSEESCLSECCFSSYNPISATDVNAYSLGWSGKYGADAGGVPWNEKTGLYTVSGSGSSYIVAHFYTGIGSCRSFQLRADYRNGGIFYRSSRDGYGFEADWERLFTTTGGTLNGAVGIGAQNTLGGHSLALGRGDTGLKQNGDGNLDVYVGNARVMRLSNGSIQVSKGLNVSGRVNLSDYSNFDIRYVRDIRLGARVVQGMQKGVTYEKSGHVITGLCLVGDADGDNSAVYRPVQKYINGTWFNVSQV